MKSKILNLITNNNAVIKNLSYLSILQILNLLAPLIIYPYLIRVLGSNEYGKILFHQGGVAFFAIIINYGFYITGVKDVAESSGDIKKLSSTVCNIFIIKFALWFLCLLLVLMFNAFITYEVIDKKLLLICFFSTFFELLFVQWFFQGVENLKPITIINGLSKILIVVLTVLLVKDSTDLYIVPFVIAGVNFLTGIISIYLMVSIYNIKFFRPKYEALYSYFCNSTPIFISNIIISIKDRTSTILIGSLLGMSHVAIYDLAVRLLNISSLPISILTDAFFPKAAREKNKSYLHFVIKTTLVISLLILLFNQISLEYIVLLLAGPEMLDELHIYKLYLLIIPISTLSLVFARFGLIAFNHNKLYMRIIFYTVVFYISCLLIGWELNLLKNLYFYIGLSIACFLFELLTRFFAVYKLGLLKK
ncbi:oligosaccharide flippase family protein [Vibrio breoganii]|uniref:oligosaccharide flippase family protein n=1 Tax=Vibrio breoganii TaxID=553239 RepID=UPI000CC0EFFF|nr:oligosaccharide flippase family protein [Vibrio breoganii]PMO27681.1 hypothetical protein BCT13_16940 [Vibrio breoganii]